MKRTILALLMALCMTECGHKDTSNTSLVGKRTGILKTPDGTTYPTTMNFAPSGIADESGLEGAWLRPGSGLENAAHFL